MPAPIQLLRPSADHSKLEVNEEGLTLLERVQTPCHVVGVSGPMHSGKSLLLNALLGLPGDLGESFKVGDTVESTTMGMWTFGAPVSSDDVSVLVLDTEGMGSSDANSNYDAQLFAVTALASSHMLYNSVGIIDQAAVEALELVVRRSNLFHAKVATASGAHGGGSSSAAAAAIAAGASAEGPTTAIEAAVHADAGTSLTEVRSEGKNDAPDGATTMPPMTWVVEGFFQDLQGESPTDWLGRLIASAHNEDGGRSIADLFPDVEAHTLFLPATELRQLQHLGQLSARERTAQYEEGVAALRRRLWSKLAASERPARTGRELAALLRILVSAVNEGLLADVPSMWELYLRDALQQHRDAASDWFAASMRRTLMDNVKPVPAATFEPAAKAVYDNALEVFDRLGRGLPSAKVADSRSELQGHLDAQLQQFAVQYRVSVTEFCSSFKEAHLTAFQDEVSQVSLRMPSAKYRDAVGKLRDDAAAKFKESVTQPYDELADDASASFQRGLDAARLAAVEKNGGVLKDMLDSALAAARAACSKDLQSKYGAETSNGERPLTDKALRALHTDASAQANDILRAEAGVAKEEDSYNHIADSLTVSCTKSFESLEKRNTDVILRQVKTASREALTRLRKTYRARDLPEADDSLKAFVASERDARLDELRKKFTLYASKSKEIDELLAEEFIVRCRTNASPVHANRSSHLRFAGFGFPGRRTGCSRRARAGQLRRGSPLPEGPTENRTGVRKARSWELLAALQLPQAGTPDRLGRDRQGRAEQAGHVPQACRH